MTTTCGPPDPSRRARRGLLALLVAAALAGGSCSSGSPVTPSQGPPAADTYLLATITVLDTGAPCLPVSCPAEYFHCADMSEVLAGTVFDFEADLAAAGIVNTSYGEPPLDPTDLNFITISLSGTDIADRIGLALEMDVTLLTTSARLRAGGTYADLYLDCRQLNAGNAPVSVFDATAAAPGTVTLTQLNVDTVTNRAIPAVAVGDAFQPASLLEGTFSFVAANSQPTATGLIQGQVRVEGCFRVNLPEPERGVPVTPAPVAPAGCP